MFSSLENIVFRLFGWYFFNFRLFFKCKICKKSFVKQIFSQQNSGNKGKNRLKTEKQSRVRIKSKNTPKRNRIFISRFVSSVCAENKKSRPRFGTGDMSRCYVHLIYCGCLPSGINKKSAKLRRASHSFMLCGPKTYIFRLD